MYELDEIEYEKVRPLFKAMDYHLAVNAIIEGTARARIYVDDLDHPEAAITWTKHRFYLVGSEHNDEFNEAVHRLFTETIYPQAIEAGEDAFVLYYSPDSWEDKIHVILKDKSPIKDRRQFYTFKKLKHNWSALLPAGFTMQRVDRKLLANRRLKHLDALVEEMQSERASVDDFLSKSFGFCLIHGDEIVSWCLSEYNSGRQCEVGIETVEGYRRRGFATLTASALIEYAIANGITTIGWHCWADNEASIATARKVGFEKTLDYPVYFARFDEFVSLS